MATVGSAASETRAHGRTTEPIGHGAWASRQEGRPPGPGQGKGCGCRRRACKGLLVTLPKEGGQGNAAKVTLLVTQPKVVGQGLLLVTRAKANWQRCPK